MYVSAYIYIYIYIHIHTYIYIYIYIYVYSIHIYYLSSNMSTVAICLYICIYTYICVNMTAQVCLTEAPLRPGVISYECHVPLHGFAISGPFSLILRSSSGKEWNRTKQARVDGWMDGSTDGWMHELMSG